MKSMIVLLFALMSFSVFAQHCTEIKATALAKKEFNSRIKGYSDLKMAVYVDSDRPDMNGWGYYNVIFTYKSSPNDRFFPNKDMVVNYLIAGSLCMIENQSYISLSKVEE